MYMGVQRMGEFSQGHKNENIDRKQDLTQVFSRNKWDSYQDYCPANMKKVKTQRLFTKLKIKILRLFFFQTRVNFRSGTSYTERKPDSQEQGF